MAYVSKEKKAKIAAALKQVVPAGWKYSLAVHHHSKIVLTIQSAPVDIIQAYVNFTVAKAALKGIEFDRTNALQHAAQVEDRRSIDVNEYHLDTQFTGELLEVFQKIRDALNTDNFDNSDVYTDYFHVGHYVGINVGRWDKPFEVNEVLKKAA
jgi:hypothetical protein